MNSKALKIGGVAAVAVIGLVLLALWQLGYLSPEPEEVSVASAVESLDEADGPNVSNIDGTWTVEAGDATFVGYRIDEVLASIDVTAVGRTSAVTGTLEASGTTVSSVEIVADMTQLKSDNSNRDNQMREQALETNDFPEARFVLTQAIDIGTIPSVDETLTFVAFGDLTLHGVTRSIEVEISGTIVGQSLVVVGSTPISRADYEINTPSAEIVASVEDEGLLEFSLVFTQ